MISPEWLRSISARIGVEGRNTIIVSGLVFSGFGLWLFVREYDHHPWMALGFLTAFFLLGTSTILIGLLRPPQPSEAAQKFLLQQVGQRFFLAGGFHSNADLVELLRVAHNVQDLPPPSAIVVGTATKEADYKEITPSEGDQLARSDRESVQRNLEREAGRIKSALGIPQIAGEPMKGPPTTEKQLNSAPESGQIADSSSKSTPKSLTEGSAKKSTA